LFYVDANVKIVFKKAIKFATFNGILPGEDW